MRSFLQRPADGIGQRLIIRVLIVSGILIVLMAAVMSWVLYKHEMNNINRSIDQIDRMNAKGIVTSLWDFDREQLITQVEGLLNFPHINYVAVRDKGKTIIEAGAQHQEDVLIREIPLTYIYNGKPTPLGTLYLQVYKPTILQGVFRHILIVLLFQTLAFAILAVSLYMLFQGMVTRHLAAAAGYFRAFDLEGGGAPLRLDRRRHGDELSVLEDTFNGMCEKLRSSYKLLVASRIEIRESEEKYRALVDNLSVGLFITNFDGLFLHANPALVKMAGYESIEDLMSVPAQELYAKASDRELLLKELRENGSVVNYEIRALRKDGSHYWVSMNAALRTAGSGKPPCVHGIVEDITARKQAEEGLRESQEKFAKAFRHAPVLISLSNVDDGTFLEVNDKFVEVSGFTREEAIGKTSIELGWISPEDRKRLIDELQASGRVNAMDLKLVSKDNRQVHCIFNGELIETGSRRVLLALAHDITERKQAEEERLRLATAIEQGAEGVIITDPNWVIQYVNPAFERMSGYDKSDLIGAHTRVLRSNKHDRDFYRNIRETLARGEVWSGRLINKRKDGSFYDAEVTGSPVRDKSGAVINHVSIHRDITQEVKLERELLQAQKMEAIGTLAGGIAHDFNNILTAVAGYAQLAYSQSPDGSNARRHLDKVLKAGSRAADLVKRILTFSRRTDQERKPVLIGSIAEEALNLLRSSLPSTIEILQEISIPPERGGILADSSQIHQVLMNLGTNAAHAMRDKGGVLSVRLSETMVDASLAARYPGLRPGPHVRLSVNDTGHGMTAAVMERIFDPYFTTKGAGEGTGLGLSVVRGIVKSHGGVITVYSEPGEGTTFYVFLPRIVEDVSHEARSTEVLPMGDERILFVDDEQILADLGKEMLESLGYEVTSKTDSLDALRAFRDHPTMFDLVVTDMTMPGLTGTALAKELMALRSDIPVILCTGFSDLINAERAKQSGIREFVMKPYVISNLAAILRKVLDGTDSIP
jgi:PAS domain S-box-containing protein